MTYQNIRLRALEPQDLDFLFQIENQVEWLSLTSQRVPLSRFVLEQYLAGAHLPLEQVKQYRFGAEHQTQGLVGFIDLYDFDAHHRRAGDGIVIAPEFQKNGYALGSLKALETYIQEVLNLHQIYAEVLTQNAQAQQLFQKAGFRSSAIFKDWWFAEGQFHDMQVYQKIIHD